MSYMLDSFKNWIRNKKRDDGSSYSEETITNYITSLKKHTNKLTDLHLKNSDIFNIDSLDEFEKVYKSIISSKDYSKVNESYHRIFSSALKVYRQFLTEQDDSHIESVVSFDMWLSKHPKHYTENTIKRYIRALQKVAEWMNIELPKPIFEIKNEDEFQAVQRKIKEHHDYENINFAHGHGDLSAALALYEQYVREISSTVEIDMDSNWWPTKSEYDPGFTVEQWTEMMSDLEYIAPENGWPEILAMFYTEKNGASCKQIGEKYSVDPQSVRSRCMQLAQRIYLRKNCPVIENDGKKKMWPILFVGRDAKPDEKGSYVWKLRPELYEALTKVNILQWLPGQKIEETMELTVKESIERIKSYIAGKGFTYEDGMVENFWLSLKSKPFVILAGTSGTGKTRLVRLFAEAIGAEYRMVPVRPDWSDSSDLLGHYNLNGDFVPGRVMKIILEAQKDPEKPYILCLDEMNLARVEYYLSDFLSVIETRDLKDGKIVSDRLLPFEDYGDIRFPENLYLVGTVNMDETTFPFSKKVLDRANTIEFNTVDLMPAADDFDDEVFPIEAGNDFLKSKYLFLSQCLDEDNREFIESVCKDLEDINQVLKTNNAHVGYRVRDEIVFYMLNNKNADLLSRDEAMDNAVMQKILPRIQGSSASVKNMLCELFKIFAGDFEGYQTQNNDTASGMFDKLSKGNIRYPKSAAKTAFMVRRFDEDGFTSYWL